MRRTILLLLIPVAIASAQDMKSWQKEQREINRDAKKFWSNFKGRFTDAVKDFRAPVDSARSAPPKSNPEAVYDYAGIDRLYKEARSFGELRGEADKKLDSTDPKAAAALLKVLLDDSKRADKLERRPTVKGAVQALRSDDIIERYAGLAVLMAKDPKRIVADR